MGSLDLQSLTDRNFGNVNHVLHLYTSKVDKYAIQAAFLVSLRKEEKVIYVTEDKMKSSIPELNFANAKLRIIKLREFRNFKIKEDTQTRFILDAGSFTGKEKTDRIDEIEGYINELGKKCPINCLCTYDVSKLSPDKIKHLTKYHNRLRLTTNDLTVLSGDFDKSQLSDDSVEKIVKDNLEIIILALLQKKPMCGTDIIETIHLEFNILLSPGTIYPLLHTLQERKLIQFERQGKAKTYTTAEDAESQIKKLVNEQIQARNLLNLYLKQETTIKRRLTEREKY